MTENNQLKNTAKVTKVETANSHSQTDVSYQIDAEVGEEQVISIQTEADEGTTDIEARKEIASVKKELERFKEFTFSKLDELAGRARSSSSSPSSTSCDDEDSSFDNEPEQLPHKKKEILERKKWSNSSNRF